MSAQPAAEDVLFLPDGAAVADLAAYLGRAKRVDPDGAARLVGHGDVLAAYVSPVHGGGGPTVLGLRTTALARPSEVDVTVSLASLNDRFARLSALPGGQRPAPYDAGPAASGPVAFPLPPTPATNASWAGVTPPRRGWQAVGLVTLDALEQAVRRGVAEVAAGTPPGAGASAVARLRGMVWGRALLGGQAPSASGGAGAADAPAGLAFAAEALGFLRDGRPAALYRSGPWTRLTTSAGHVLARRPSLLT